MANPHNQASPNQAGAPAPGPASGPTAANTNDVTALLLEVLRNVNRQVESTRPADKGASRELEGNAQKAVEHFRQISLELRTPADGAASFGPARSATTAGTESAGATAAPATTGAAAAPARPR